MAESKLSRYHTNSKVLAKTLILCKVFLVIQWNLYFGTSTNFCPSKMNAHNLCNLLPPLKGLKGTLLLVPRVYPWWRFHCISVWQRSLISHQRLWISPRILKLIDSFYEDQPKIFNYFPKISGCSNVFDQIPNISENCQRFPRNILLCESEKREHFDLSLNFPLPIIGLFFSSIYFIAIFAKLFCKT